MGVELIYTVVSASAVQQGNQLYVYVYTFFILFPYRSFESME